MGQRSKGQRTHTRKLFTIHRRERGITHLLRTFEIGEQVTIKIDSSHLRGAPHARFQGFSGTIVRKQGRAYLVDVPFLSKQTLSTVEHLI